MRLFGRPGRPAGCSVPTPAEGRRPSRSAGDRLFRELAAHLDVDGLEAAIAAAIVQRMPTLTAIVRVGSSERPPRSAGPCAARVAGRAGLAEGILAVPIESGGEAHGFVGFAQDAALRSAAARAERVLMEVAAEAAVPARNALRHAAALEAALKDPLTSLSNRRGLLEVLDRQARGARRHGRPLALLLLDLDNLKGVNDSRGHAAGDAALRTLAAVLQESVRRADVVARLGGDEFAVLCPDTTADAARRAGHRIERALAARETPLDDGTLLVGLGVSWGVSELEPAAPSPGPGPDAPAEAAIAALFEAADADLYQAKAARRRRAARTAAGGRA